jgi:hypothetical protein
MTVGSRLAGAMEKVMEEVGPLNVAAVVTNEAGKVDMFDDAGEDPRRSRELLKAKFPHIVIYRSWRIRVTAELR